jgi:hypothetical protein
MLCCWNVTSATFVPSLSLDMGKKWGEGGRERESRVTGCTLTPGRKETKPTMKKTYEKTNQLNKEPAYPL